MHVGAGRLMTSSAMAEAVSCASVRLVPEEANSSFLAKIADGQSQMEVASTSDDRLKAYYAWLDDLTADASNDLII